MTSTQDSHISDATVESHGTGEHATNPGHDDHADGHGDALGPVSAVAWGAGAVGIIGGLIVAFALAVAAGWLG